MLFGFSKFDALKEFFGELGLFMLSFIIFELMEVVMVKFFWMLFLVEIRLFIIEREDVLRIWV